MKRKAIHNTSLLAATILALIASVCVAPTVSAHESLDKRVLTVQIGQDRISLLLYYKMAAGEVTRALHLKYDTDHSGQIDTPTEINTFGQIMLPVALAHLSFEVVGERPGALEPSLKFRLLEDGSLEMMVLMEYTLPDMSEPGAKRTLRVALSKDPHALETGVEFQAIAPVELFAFDGKPIDATTDARRFALEQGHSHDLTGLYRKP